MKLACNVSVGDRLIPKSSHGKFIKSTLALCKTESFQFCLLLFSSQYKNGNKYKLDHINRISARFISEGKATIQFETPPHDLFIQADSLLLKSFMLLVRRALENKLTEKEVKCIMMSGTATPSKPAPKKLIIEKSSDFPFKGFPPSIEELHVIYMKRSSLDRGILNLTNLRLLNISHNSIQKLPVEMSKLPNLAELNASHNKLGENPSKQWAWTGGQLSQTLKLLNVSHNSLKVLPTRVVDLRALISLHIDYNEIKSLPCGIGNLRHLKLLTASNNLISTLPGSAVKWRLQNLDLSKNKFNKYQHTNSATVLPRPFPVITLRECAARKVLQSELLYSPETLPRTLVESLENTKYCICGKACFDLFVRQVHVVYLTTLAQNFNISCDELVYVPIDSYFCSLSCFNSAQRNYRRPPIF